jgi:uncharacterized protein (TIGR03083 family)
MVVSPRYDGPSIISISGTPDDQLAPTVRQRHRFQAMLEDLGDEQWSAASRCDGWTVQDVVAHLVGVNTFWHASIRAGLAGAPTRIMGGFDPVTTPALMVSAMRELTPGEVLDQFAASNEAFLGALTALDDEGWATVAEAPVGHITVRVLAHHALWDCWIHERDIALPLGFTPPAVADELRSSLRYAGALNAAYLILAGQTFAEVVSVETSDSPLRFIMDVGQSVTVSDDVGPGDAPCLRGPAVSLIEALSVRGPLPASIPSRWRDLLAGLATAFNPVVSPDEEHGAAGDR